jgi:hypothetical protein
MKLSGTTAAMSTKHDCAALGVVDNDSGQEASALPMAISARSGVIDRTDGGRSVTDVRNVAALPETSRRTTAVFDGVIV